MRVRGKNQFDRSSYAVYKNSLSEDWTSDLTTSFVTYFAFLNSLKVSKHSSQIVSDLL